MLSRIDSSFGPRRRERRWGQKLNDKDVLPGRRKQNSPVACAPKRAGAKGSSLLAQRLSSV